MKVGSGKVANGKVIVHAELPEGADVTRSCAKCAAVKEAERWLLAG